MKHASKLLGATGTFALAILSINPAYAAGTTAGSTITNTVTVNYQVGGVAQTAVQDADTFTVDRKVNLTVAQVGTVTTEVSPGQSAAVTTFLVTNLSNATLDFALTVAQQDGGAAANGGTDSFDATNVRIYRDANGDGLFDAGDTLVTYLDELAADGSVTVFVVADIPLGEPTDSVAAVTLTATAGEGGTAGTEGAVLTATIGGNTSGMDTVFADLAGATDALYDGAFSAKDDYTVRAAALSVVKSSRIISDPINGTTDPKFIPGAVIEYCIAVSNAAGSATATDVAIGDPLPSQVTYLSTFGIFLDGTVDASNQCEADGASGGNYDTPTTTVSGTLSSVPQAETRTLLFRATIN